MRRGAAAAAGWRCVLIVAGGQRSPKVPPPRPWGRLAGGCHSQCKCGCRAASSAPMGRAGGAITATPLTRGGMCAGAYPGAGTYLDQVSVHHRSQTLQGTKKKMYIRGGRCRSTLPLRRSVDKGRTVRVRHRKLSTTLARTQGHTLIILKREASGERFPPSDQREHPSPRAKRMNTWLCCADDCNVVFREAPLCSGHLC